MKDCRKEVFDKNSYNNLGMRQPSVSRRQEIQALTTIFVNQRLKIQNERCGGSNPTFSAYESAIERTSWMRKASSLVHSGEHRTK